MVALGREGGGGPPVATRKGGLTTAKDHYVDYLDTWRRAQRAAVKRRASGKRSSGGGSQFGGIPYGPPQQQGTQPIINPFPKVLAGVAADTKDAQKQVALANKQAQKALKGLGVNGPGVAGAGSADIYAGSASGIEGTSRGIRQGIGTDAAKFVMEQIAQRQQFQMEQMQRNQITPDTLRQLVAAGIDPNRVNLNDPFAVAMALGQAQRQGQSGGGGLSFGQIASLAQAGIDPSQYQNDPFGAAMALGKSKRSSTTPSAADIAALIKAASG
jgi:hypothetical protein